MAERRGAARRAHRCEHDAGEHIDPSVARRRRPGRSPEGCPPADPPQTRPLTDTTSRVMSSCCGVPATNASRSPMTAPTISGAGPSARQPRGGGQALATERVSVAVVHLGDTVGMVEAAGGEEEGTRVAGRPARHGRGGDTLVRHVGDAEKRPRARACVDGDHVVAVALHLARRLADGGHVAGADGKRQSVWGAADGRSGDAGTRLSDQDGCGVAGWTSASGICRPVRVSTSGSTRGPGS